jgi:3-hydroxy-D-aspartate aldolase
MTAPRSNDPLLGVPGGAAGLDTPALVLDLDAVDRNLAAMAAWARQRGVGLRPHAKTHKSVELGRRQMAAGAIGLCCAKLSEAEVLADGGLEHLLICSPVIQDGKLPRLAALNVRIPGLMATIDDPDAVAALAAAVAPTGRTLELLIDCDIGTHRFGVTSPEAAVALANRIAQEPSLRLMGIQGYCGHVQSMPDYAERRALSHASLAQLGAIRDALRAAGHACPIVSGGGTGTHDFDTEPGVMTDLQVGSYLFMDVVYGRAQLTPNGAPRFEPALFVWTRVVSNRQPGFATTDAGFKAFSTDAGPPTIAFGAPDGATYAFFGDEFGRVIRPEGAPRPALGTLVGCVVPHCDPNANLYDFYHGVRGDTLESIIPIDARGCSS